MTKKMVKVLLLLLLDDFLGKVNNKLFLKMQ